MECNNLNFINKRLNHWDQGNRKGKILVGKGQIKDLTFIFMPMFLLDQQF